MRDSILIALVIQAGCASSGPPVAEGPELMETAEWSFVDAGIVDEVGETLPGHVTVLGSRYEMYEIGRTRAVRGAPGRIVVFCDLSGARYYTGEDMPVSSGRGTVSVRFTVRRRRYQLGETVQQTDRVVLGRDVFRCIRFDRGRALSTGPLETEALVTAAMQLQGDPRRCCAAARPPPSTGVGQFDPERSSVPQPARSRTSAAWAG